MSTCTQNDGSDQTDDFRTREKFICSICGFEFNEENCLRDHFKHCQDIEDPVNRLAAAIVKSEDCTTELKQSHEFDEVVTRKEIIDIKVEDMSFTEYTVSGFNCKVSDPPMEQQSTELEEHTKIHSGGNPYGCKVCDFVTTKPRYLQAHIRRYHSGMEQLLKCTICDYGCVHSSTLIMHMRVHTGEKPFQCTLCDYACTTRNRLKCHVRTHTREKPFKCPLCDYACSQAGTLKGHMRTHTGEKPFKCAICDYACARSANLTIHMRTHTREKPFKCSNCDYACGISANLTKHMKIHQRETI